jgi:WD40 repeat protein
MLRSISTTVLACSLAALTGCSGAERMAGNEQGYRSAYDYAAEENPRVPSLAGSYVITIDDADPPVTTYTDDRRLPPEVEQGDTITVLQLPIQPVGGAMPYVQIPVSNTVSGPLEALEISEDGRTLLAITFDAPTPSEIPVVSGGVFPGTGILPIDLTDPLNPVVGEKLDLSEQGVISVSIHPDGDLALALCYGSNELYVLELEGGQIVNAEPWPLEIDTRQPYRPSSVDWHPSGRGFAINYANTRWLNLHEFIREGESGSWEIQPWGETVDMGPYAYTGRFSPDGQYYYTADLAWSGRTGWFATAAVGYFSAYRIDPIVAPGAMHQRLGSVTVGRSPIAFDVSPDGSLIAVANAEGGFVPNPEAMGATDTGYLMLLHHDGEGHFEILTEVETQVIPAGVRFTPDGGHVLVAGYDENIVSVWEVQQIDGRPVLVDTFYGIEPGTGPHDVIVLP